MRHAPYPSEEPLGHSLARHIAAGLAAALVVCASTAAHAQEGEDSESPTPEERVAKCANYRALYVESAARKLYRAMASREGRPDKLGLGDTLAISGRRGGEALERSFEVRDEREGRAAGLIDGEDWSTTFVLVSRAGRPVVVRQSWPARQMIGAGRAACAPTRSTIMVPDAPVARVPLDPFVHWGLRVMWLLPDDSKREQLDVRRAMQRALGLDEDGDDPEDGAVARRP
jgi:hypothetical protein